MDDEQFAIDLQALLAKFKMDQAIVIVPSVQAVDMQIALIHVDSSQLRQTAHWIINNIPDERNLH